MRHTGRHLARCKDDDCQEAAYEASEKRAAHPSLPEPRIAPLRGERDILW